MTDKTIPADQARRARQWARDTLDDVENGANVSAYARDAARTLITMMPRPTLADMTPEEREKCKWMQADTSRWGHAVIICPDVGDGRAALLDGWGHVDYEPHSKVTPRPDLPRMEWPGTEKPAPALPDGWRLADHKKHGRVIVTRPDPDEEGEAAIIRTLPARPSRAVLTWCDSDELTYTDQEADQ